MSTEDEPITEILQRHKDEGLVQIGREALADAQATSIVGMDHDAIVTRSVRLELALGYVLSVIDHTCADRATIKVEMEQMRAAKRHLSERISIGQEGWNEIYREVEQLRAERDALLRHDKEAVQQLNAAEAELTATQKQRDALKAAIATLRTQRCPSCDHLTNHHKSEGCWYSVATGREGHDLVCPCTVPSAALDAPQRPEDAGDPLHTAIECVLLDHADEIDGNNADPNISELAYVYRQRTGWTVEQERPEDTREPGPKTRAVSVESPGNDGFRYEPISAPETTPDAPTEETDGR